MKLLKTKLFEAGKRKIARSERTANQQIALLNKRPGEARRERKRLSS